MKINYTTKPLVVQFGKTKIWVGKRVKHHKLGEAIIILIEDNRIYLSLPDGTIPPCSRPDKGYCSDSINISDL